MWNVKFEKANAEYLIHCMNEREPIRAPQSIDEVFALAGACFASIQLSIQSGIGLNDENPPEYTNEEEALLRRNIEFAIRTFADTILLVKEGKYDEQYPSDKVLFSIGTEAEAKEAERQSV